MELEARKEACCLWEFIPEDGLLKEDRAFSASRAKKLLKAQNLVRIQKFKVFSPSIFKMDHFSQRSIEAIGIAKMTARNCCVESSNTAAIHADTSAAMCID